MRERDNLLAVVRRALSRPHPSPEECELAFRAMFTLRHLIEHREPLATYAEHTDTLLAKLAAPVSLELRARAHLLRGTVHGLAGRLREGHGDYEEALRLVRSIAPAASSTETIRALEVQILTQLGLALTLGGRLVEARGALEAAHALRATKDDPRALARVLCYLAIVAMEEGRAEEARATFDHALELSRAHQSTVRLGFALAMRGWLELELGRLDSAEKWVHRALSAQEATGHLAHKGWTFLLRAVLSHLRREEGAAAHLETARDLAHRMGLLRLEALCVGTRGLLRFRAGEDEEGRGDLHRARSTLARVGDRRYEAYVAACLATVEAASGCLADAEEPLSFATAALGRGPDRFAPALAFARALVERASAPSGRDGPLPYADAPVVPFCVRLLQEAIAGRPLVTPPLRELWVGAGGCWFQVSGSAPVDLSRRGAHRRLLARLTEHRIAAPGKALDWSTLSECGWPGLRLEVEPAFARVRTTIYELRRIGLQGILCTRDDGYLIDPSVGARWKSDRERAPRSSL